MDGAGNAYVAGSTFSTDFPTQNALQNANAGNADLFVTRIAADGASLVYSTYIGGSEDDSGNTDNDKPGIAVDAGGVAYVGGTTQSVQFPTTAGVFDDTGPGPYAIKLTPAGAYAYATLLGSDDFAFVRDVAVYDGRLTLLGYTGNTDIPVTPGVVKPAKNPNGEDIFLIQVNANGTGFSFATYFGGTDENDDFAEGLAIDDGGALYLVGTTSSADYPITIGSPVSTAQVPVLSKLNPGATATVYSTRTAGVQPLAVAVDALGRASITGGESDNDVLFEQFDADGFGQFATAFSSGAGSNDVGNGIAVDAFGHAYLAGRVTRNNFPGEDVENTNPFQAGLSVAPDAFVIKVDRDDPIVPPPAIVPALPVRLLVLLAAVMLWLGYHLYQNVLPTRAPK